MLRSINKRSFILIALLLIAFAGNLAAHKSRGRRRNYADFHCFYTTGQRMLNYQKIYIKGDLEVAEYRYSPIFAVFMSGLARLNEDTADTLWYSFNFLLVILSLAILGRANIPKETNTKHRILAYALVILMISRLILINLDTGQTNILMLASILLGLYFINNRREAPGAFILGISIAIKYTPLIFIPYFIARRNFRAAAFTIAAVLTYFFILPAIFIGVERNILYLKELLPFLTQSSILDQGTMLDPKNQSLVSAIQRLFTNCASIWANAPRMPFQNLKLSPFMLKAIPATAAILLYLSILIRRPGNKESQGQKTRYLNLDYALIFICLIMYNLNAWPANFIFLTPAYFLLVWRIIEGGWPKNKLILTCLIISYLLNIATQKSLFGQDFAYKAYFYSPFTLSALVVFGALLGLKYGQKPLK